MPHKPIDYNNTIIYKLVSRDLAIKSCYVGHTTQFTDRKCCHKKRCNANQETYVYRFINENGGWDNWDMVMIEAYPCKDVNEACMRERHWIETLNADLNQMSPPTGLSKSEYAKKRYIENVDKFKQYRIENKDRDREVKKRLYIQNMDKLKEKQKQHRIDNKDKIKQYRSTRFCCIICRNEMNRDNFNRHYKALHNNIST
jgi:hypothetical protein